mmetsp:Transcript_7543/g.10371  ORF Transcript_7543/g.10371 Transcript_7543/m.10371 type:complete len:139 (+) Transcript_7543:99-515(+)
MQMQLAALRHAQVLMNACRVRRFRANILISSSDYGACTPSVNHITVRLHRPHHHHHHHHHHHAPDGDFDGAIFDHDVGVVGITKFSPPFTIDIESITPPSLTDSNASCELSETYPNTLNCPSSKLNPPRPPMLARSNL